MSDEKILARLDSIDEKVTSTKHGVERLEEEIYIGRDGRQPIVARLAAIEKNGKSIVPRKLEGGGGTKVQLALIALVVTIVSAISAFAMKAIH